MAISTATDVIDGLAERVMKLVEQVNAGQELTRAEFAAAFERAFAAALPVFLESLDAQNPALAARLRSQLLAEHDEPMGAAAIPACGDCGAAAGEPCVHTCRTHWSDGPVAE